MLTPPRPGRRLPTALESATFAVALLEDDPLYNSGRGAVFTRDGINELEASVMVSRGFAKRGVGVMGLRRVRSPIALARAMLEHGDGDLSGRGGSARAEAAVAAPDVPGAQGHTQVFGPTAEALARLYGLEMVDPAYFFTQRRWDEHIRGLEREKAGRGVASWSSDEFLPQGTCGAVALDEHGVLCTATSTGGLTNKLTGRIGDTPVVGAGFWAEEWSEHGDPTAEAAREGFLASDVGPAVVLSGALHRLLADCLPNPFLYTPIPPPRPGARPLVTTRSIAVSGTGNGDSFLRTSAARTIAAIARFRPTTGASAIAKVAGPQGELQRSAGDRWGRTGEGEGGTIGIECVVVRGCDGNVVDTRIDIVQAHNCGGMFRAWIGDDGVPVVRIWRDDDDDDDEDGQSEGQQWCSK